MNLRASGSPVALHGSMIYVEADFLDQAVDDRTRAWVIERRQQ